MNKIDQSLADLNAIWSAWIENKKQNGGQYAAQFEEHGQKVFNSAPRKLQLEYRQKIFDEIQKSIAHDNDPESNGSRAYEFSQLINGLAEASQEYLADKKLEKEFAAVSNEIAQENVGVALKKKTICFRPKYQRPSGMRYRLKRTVRQVFGGRANLLCLPKSITQPGDKWDVRPQNGREILLIRVE